MSVVIWLSSWRTCHLVVARTRRSSGNTTLSRRDRRANDCVAWFKTTIPMCFTTLRILYLTRSCWYDSYFTYQSRIQMTFWYFCVCMHLCEWKSCWEQLEGWGDVELSHWWLEEGELMWHVAGLEPLIVSGVRVSSKLCSYVFKLTGWVHALVNTIVVTFCKNT